jgi:N-acetyl-anhydromuramyl-L-alanine amidase AmpD
MQTFAIKSRTVPASGQASPAHARSLQRTPDVRRILHGPQVQPKLTIGAVNDPAEHEADRVADQVMRMAEPQQAAHAQLEHRSEVHEQLPGIQTKSPEVSNPTHPNEKEADEVARKVVGGQSAEIHGTGGTVDRKGEGSVRTTPEFQSKLAISKASGRPLEDSMRSAMESKLDSDFGDVRVHTGNAAHAMSESINARAFTHGSDIYFRHGEYHPTAKLGKELLAHELVHTRQQREENDINRSPDHEPGKDYSSGTITAKGQTMVKTANKKANVEHDKHPVYFQEGDSVAEISSSPDKMWVEVKGAAHFHDGKTEQPLADAQGWVPRRSTSMTLGLFAGLDIKDETYTGAGGITSGQAIGSVTNIVLHQTDSSTAIGTLSQYKADAAKGVGAQYLIGEDGKIHLVVPINERVGHVRGNRPVKVPKPKVADPEKVTDAEMKATRTAIDKFYNELNTANIISRDLHDYWQAMDSQTLYNALDTSSWQLNNAVSNRAAVGIEVVKRHSYATYDVTSFQDDYSRAQMDIIKTRIDDLVIAKKIKEDKKSEVLRTSEKDEIQKSTDKAKYPEDAAKTNAIENIDKKVYAKLKEGGWKIGGHKIYVEKIAPEFGDLTQSQVDDFIKSVMAMHLSPQLEAQILKTEERDKLAKEKVLDTTTAERKTAIQDKLKTLNEELFNFIKEYDFKIYEDVSGAQKYSMWLLVGKLVQNYRLDPKRDVVGHEDVDKKIVGEGQSQAEFIRTMTDFTDNVKLIDEISMKAPSKESKEQIREKWKYELDIVSSLDKGETGNTAVTEFFNAFYTKISAFNKSGAVQLIKLYRQSQKMEY